MGQSLRVVQRQEARKRALVYGSEDSEKRKGREWAITQNDKIIIEWIIGKRVELEVIRNTKMCHLARIARSVECSLLEEIKGWKCSNWERLRGCMMRQKGRACKRVRFKMRIGYEPDKVVSLDQPNEEVIGNLSGSAWELLRGSWAKGRDDCVSWQGIKRKRKVVLGEVTWRRGKERDLKGDSWS